VVSQPKTATAFTIESQVSRQHENKSISLIIYGWILSDQLFLFGGAAAWQKWRQSFVESLLLLLQS
jgi:hypothetical protein